VVFTGHPSLRCGDAVDLLNAWKSDPKNALILTDPEFDVIRTLSVHEPIKMRVYPILIDRRLKVGSQELDKLMKQWNPKRLFVHEKYSQRFPTTKAEIFPFKQFVTTKLPLARQFETCEISPEFSGHLMPLSLGAKSIAHFSGNLSLLNGGYKLENAEDGDAGSQAKCIWGAPSQESIFDSLKSEGHEVEIVKKTEQDVVIFKILKLSASVEFHKSKTIIFASNLEIRAKLRDLILEDCDYFHKYVQ